MPGAEITLPIFCIWGPTRSCLRVPWQDTAFKPKFTAPVSTTSCFHTWSWFWCVHGSGPDTSSCPPAFHILFFRNYPIFWPAFLRSCSIMPGSLCAWWLSLSSLLVPLSFLLLWTCPVLFWLFSAGVLPVLCQRLGITSVCLWLCPALYWLNQLRLGLLVLEQGDGQQSLTEVTKEYHPTDQ